MQSAEVTPLSRPLPLPHPLPALPPGRLPLLTSEHPPSDPSPAQGMVMWPRADRWAPHAAGAGRGWAHDLSQAPERQVGAKSLLSLGLGGLRALGPAAAVDCPVKGRVQRQTEADS